VAYQLEAASTSKPTRETLKNVTCNIIVLKIVNESASRPLFDFGD
jgi:hypothetical protein